MAISFSYGNSSIQVLKIASTLINETIQMHSHGKDCYEIHLIEEGEGILETPNEKFKLKKGSFYITGPHILHKQITNENNPMKELSLYLVVKQTSKSYSVIQCFTSYAFWFGNTNKMVESIIKQLIKENEHLTQWSEDLIASLIIMLIVEMVKLYEPTTTDVYQHKKVDLNESRLWLLDRMFYSNSANGTLEDFAERLGVSTRQLQRIIKDTYGSTFKKIRNETRLSKAATILEKEKISIEECATQCGYMSVVSFEKAFKMKYGITPKEYKKSKNFNNKI